MALVEVLEEDFDNAAARLVNLSTRSFVGSGENVEIAGFIVSGDAPKTFVVRAAGPALSQFGISSPLSDPVLQLYRRDGTKVVENDDWSPAISADLAAVNAWPWTPGSKDAAVVVTLPPGGYTVIISGKNGAQGVALVELYERN